MATETRTTEGAYLRLVQEFPLRPLKSEADLDRAIAMLDRLIDLGESERSEDEDDYMDVLGTLVMEYEEVHWPMPSDLEEREVLRLHREAWLASEEARDESAAENP